MADLRLSVREALQWLDWLARVRWLLLGGLCVVPLAGACLLYLDLPVQRTTTLAVVIGSLAAPYVLVVAALLRTLSAACTIARALRQREQQRAPSRRGAARPPAAQGTPPSPPGEGHGALETPREHELRTPLHLVQANVALLSEAFADIVPVLDQHEAAGPHLRIARLDYPFFRAQLPAVLQDLSTGVARIASVLREAAPPPGGEAFATRH